MLKRSFKDSPKLILSSCVLDSTSTTMFSSSGNSFTQRQLMVFTTRPIVPQITATILHPAAPPPNASTPLVTANPITIFVATANIKRMEPS